MNWKKFFEHPIPSGLAVIFLAWLATVIIPPTRKLWAKAITSLGAAGASFVDWLGTPVSVPLGFILLAALVVIACLLIARNVHSWVDEASVRLAKADRFAENVEAKATAIQNIAANIQNAVTLTSEERTIVKHLASLDGSGMTFETAVELLGSSRLRAKSMLSRLQEKDLIEQEMGSYGIYVWVLTDEGRELVIERGWA